MKQIEINLGSTIESTLEDLKIKQESTGERYYCNFNGSVIISEDTIDSAYIRITGQTKSELDAAIKKKQDEYKKRSEEHKQNIPKLTTEWIEKGKLILDKSYWELWEKCVPIRLDDLYMGMELGCTLDICEILNKSENLEDVFQEGKEKFYSQGHSGMSAGLVFSMIASFHKLGKEFKSKMNELK